MAKTNSKSGPSNESSVKLDIAAEGTKEEEYDYVLVYEEEEDNDEESKLKDMREQFEKSLTDAGLILTYHHQENATRHLVSSWFFFWLG